MRMIVAAWEDSSQQPLCILIKEESLSNNQSYNYIIRLREMDFVEHLRERERHSGKIFKVSGPLIVAEGMRGAKINELVKVGYEKIMGEIVKLQGNSAFILCYEDTVGLAAGDPVQKTWKPLEVELGPGILSQLFDGAQRPLVSTADYSQSIYMQKGAEIPSLNPTKQWQFRARNIKEGDKLNAGDIIGVVYENDLLQEHFIMVPPLCSGKVTYIAPNGDYTIHEEILELEEKGKKIKITMSQKWPLRQPRPFVERQNEDVPLLTGLRVLDALFPLALGGTCTIPGSFGCGQSLVKNCIWKASNISTYIYVGCGERSNELVRVLDDLACITTEKNGKQYSVMNRTSIVANTTNMPLAAREASIYMGMAIAEYFRDMGKDVLLMADSTSRWTETLREISCLLREMPGENGYPTYLTCRLSQFYGRAGKVKCLGSPQRHGSVTVIGTVSPSGESFDTVLSSTRSITQAFWALDRRMAQIRHYPEVNWNTSTSNYDKTLDDFYTKHCDKEFPVLRQKIKQILRKEDQLFDVSREKGREYMSDQENLVLEVGKIIRQEFLQQNVFMSSDYYCPLEKTAGMMKAIVCYYELACQTLDKANKKPKIFNFLLLKAETRPQLRKLQQMKYQEPKQSPKDLNQAFSKLLAELVLTFDSLMNK